MSLIGALLGEVTPIIVGLRATEVALVWKAPWSPIADIMLANVAFLKRGNQSDCHKIAAALSAFTETGLLWSEIILAMRTWAIWGATRPMLIFLILWVTANFIVSTILAQRFFDLVKYIDVPSFLVPALHITCAPLPGHDAIWPELLVYAINEAGIAILALVRGFRQYRSIKNPLLATMFHDDFQPRPHGAGIPGQLDGGSTTLPTIQFDERDNVFDDDSEDGPSRPEGQGWTWSR
ncbi:hypothetical protein Clacol_003140 [Clathrus columnatus]|uniref:Uncharacterized protein n=1 Tax=Clathrus columnatus TaxID=1419009 RepID=A0AAV5AAG5_9AGAM|nr:hypothetical protein Clacol_003140 [Clathrus columnatus]